MWPCWPWTSDPRVSGSYQLSCRPALPCLLSQAVFCLFVFSNNTQLMSSVNFTGLLWNANQSDQARKPLENYGMRYIVWLWPFHSGKRKMTGPMCPGLLWSYRGQWPSRPHSSASAAIRHLYTGSEVLRCTCFSSVLARCSSAALKKARSSPSLSTVLRFQFKAEFETFDKNPWNFLPSLQGKLLCRLWQGILQAGT